MKKNKELAGEGWGGGGGSEVREVCVGEKVCEIIHVQVQVQSIDFLIQTRIKIMLDMCMGLVHWGGGGGASHFSHIFLPESELLPENARPEKLARSFLISCPVM